ncbi:lipopolysaccharide heptosyltransferase II [Methylobacter sp. Wu1]|uniref:lipopolysaccharide heptosyltransferase II n=1 Tax=Methylobacter sp. Wu1 TaxID=3119359 RepID=UPI002F93B9CF
MPKSNITKILVVGPSWVGDMVMAQSLFITLKQADPHCQIDVLAPAWTFSLLERMPEVATAIPMPLKRGQFGLINRIKLGRQLRSAGYDQAILLPNSWKSALIPFFADIPRRTGYIGECRWGLLNDARKLDKKRLTMTVQRFVALGLPKAAVLPPAYPAPRIMIGPDRQRVIEKFNLTRSEKILALCPGAEYGPAKRWSAGYYAEVARQKIAQGWQVWLFGSDKDKDVAEVINQEAGRLCTDFSGRTSLAEAVDLLSLASTVVTNDSGLMHVAAALDRKVIAIYGSSDPGFTPPLNKKAQVVSLNLDCAPCFKRDCPLGHTRCLTEIRPDQVLDLIAAD